MEESGFGRDAGPLNRAPGSVPLAFGAGATTAPSPGVAGPRPVPLGSPGRPSPTFPSARPQLATAAAGSHPRPATSPVPIPLSSARVSGAGGGPPPPTMARRGVGRRKVRPNLGADREGTRLLNLTVLCRLDPAVADILITAAHVTAYSFDPDTIQWSRKGVEGSLFVVKRDGAQNVYELALIVVDQQGS